MKTGFKYITFTKQTGTKSLFESIPAHDSSPYMGYTMSMLNSIKSGVGIDKVSTGLGKDIPAFC
jgi:hypothetical protein